MTLNEFEQQCWMLQNTEERDLETYLLALLNLVEQHSNQPATPELLLELLQSAFTESPATLDSSWLHIKSAPKTTEEKKRLDVYRTKKATEGPNRVADLQRPPNLFAGIFDGIAYTITTLLYGAKKASEAPNQIADLQSPPDLFAGRSFDGIAYTKAVLQFQIAELHKMRGKQLADEGRSMGIYSETGNRWYNFSPKSNISCGIQCFLDHGSDEEAPFETDWETLGLLLEMGRMYE